MTSIERNRLSCSRKTVIYTCCIGRSLERNIYIARLSQCVDPSPCPHTTPNTKSLPEFTGRLLSLLGNVLLSQDPSVQVPSALEGLTVVFEMGTRGSPPPLSPNIFCYQEVLGIPAKYSEFASSAYPHFVGLFLLPENRMRNVLPRK